MSRPPPGRGVIPHYGRIPVWARIPTLAHYPYLVLPLTLTNQGHCALRSVESYPESFNTGVCKLRPAHRVWRGCDTAATMPMTPLVLDWQRTFDTGFRTCGGKGYHLARLARYGFPVPDGGVVVAEVYHQLMQASSLAAHTQALTALRAEDVMETAAPAQLTRLQEAIVATGLPDQACAELETFLCGQQLTGRAMAVRSSAVSEDGPHASFAGIHNSVLNVRGLDVNGWRTSDGGW